MKRLAIAFGIFIVIIVILADTRNLGFLYSIYDFRFGDKVGHFLIFGLLSLVVNLSVLETGSPSDASTPASLETIRSVIKTCLILALIVGLEEFSQRWFPSRTSDWFDLSASYLGIASFAFLAIAIKTRRSLLK
jgi:VanZ family protein